MIYFVSSPDDPRALIKIGFTNGPVEHRVAQLQEGNPFSLYVMATTPGVRIDERTMHGEFKEYKCHGEWFYPGYRLCKLIRRLQGLVFERLLRDLLSSDGMLNDYCKKNGTHPEDTRESLQRILASGDTFHLSEYLPGERPSFTGLPYNHEYTY